MGLKTYDYIVTLKPTKNYKAFDWITQLLLLLAISLIAYNLFYAPRDSSRTFIGVIFLTGILVSAIYSRITGSSYRFALFWAAMCFLIVLKSWGGMAFLVLAFLEKQIKFKREFGFDDEGITINSFPGKAYKWYEVSNVVLKDDIITVDLYNNKVIQSEIDSEITGEMEKEFNEFCRSHLLSV